MSILEKLSGKFYKCQENFNKMSGKFLTLTCGNTASVNFNIFKDYKIFKNPGIPKNTVGLTKN